ncbi:MAG: hypothetical protein WC750_01490 [Patescibacteria group bacterium]|jgi:hypothetical protein
MYEEVVYTGAPSGPPVGWIIFGAIVAILVIIGLALLIRWIKKRLSRPETWGMSREEVSKRWQEIRKVSEQSGQMGMKMALMEADKLLDSALKSIMMPGDTLGERLKSACYKYPKLKEVWWAHKLRNQLVHEHDFRLSDRETRRALDEFEKAFKTLNVL